MNAEIFSEARRVFEILPGVGTLEGGIAKLARAGVPRSQIRGWAISICEEYGISEYVGPGLDRLMRRAAKLTQAEER